MRVALALILVFSVSACGGNPFWLPRAHKVTVQQGNLVNKAQLDKVAVGMDRESVRGLIGTPVASTPFHADRWDYVYTSAPAGRSVVARRVSINFVDGKVSDITSNEDEVSGVIPAQRYFWEPRGEAYADDF